MALPAVHWKKLSGFLFMVSGGMFLLAAYTGGQPAFYAIGAVFLALGAIYLRRAKNA